MSVARDILELVGEEASYVFSVARKSITGLNAKVNLQKAKKDQFKQGWCLTQYNNLREEALY